MVTVINYQKRQNSKGNDFYTLDLQGEVEMIRAVDTGKFYAHAKKASITTTLNEQVCKSLVGTKFPGKIVKVACDEFSYKVPGTNETIILNHNYQYIADNANVEEAIFSEGIS